MTVFRDALKKAREKLNRGAFREAFSLIVDEPVNRPDDLFAKIGILTDAGVALRDKSALRYGLYLMERHAEEILAVPSYAPYHSFNLANLRINLMALEEAEGGSRAWYQREETVPARQAYQKAAVAAQDPRLKSRILSAHGQLLTGLGRDWEAFDLFHQALRLNPEEKEALWGRTSCLAALAGTAPSREKELLREALENLKKIINGENDDAARELAGELEERLGPEESAKEASFPKNTIVTHEGRIHNRVMFALESKLFINLCASCRLCDRAVGDFGILGPAHAVVGEGPPGRYPRMAAIFGRLVERYQVLRRLAADHHGGSSDYEEGADFMDFPALQDWQSAPGVTAAAMTALAGSSLLLGGMASYLGVYLGQDPPSPPSLPGLFGSAPQPRALVLEKENPALHAFWDLWTDGREDLVKGALLPEKLAFDVSSPDVELFLADPLAFTEEVKGLLGWYRSLLGYLIRLADREARGEVKNPPAWPLQPFVKP